MAMASTPPTPTAASQDNPMLISLERYPEDVDEAVLGLGLVPAGLTELELLFEELTELGLLLTELGLLPEELVVLGLLPV